MAKISDILELEDKNTNMIYLYKSGGFLRCYNHSAFLFWRYISPLKVTKMYVKYLNRNIEYLGFSFSNKNKYLNNKPLNDINGVLCYPIEETINEEEYIQWLDFATESTKKQESFTPHTSIIEKQPVFITTLNVVSDCLNLGRNIPKTDLIPYGNEMKNLSYELGYLINTFYDYEDRNEISNIIKDKIRKLQYTLKILKEVGDISIVSFSLQSERLESIKKQIENLCRKVTG